MTSADERERRLSLVEVLTEAALGRILLAYEVLVVVPDLEATSQLVREAAHIEVPGWSIGWILAWLGMSNLFWVASCCIKRMRSTKRPPVSIRCQPGRQAQIKGTYCHRPS
jgi:hypothetical protein